MLTIKKRFPSRELYLAAGVVASVVTAGAIAAIVSAHGLVDQSAVMPTKIVKTNDKPKSGPAPQVSAETPAKEYAGIARPHSAKNTPTAPTGQPTVATPSSSPEPTPSVSPEPSPEPTPSVEPSPEPTPEP